MLDKQLTLEHYIVSKLDEMQREKAERLANTIPNWLTRKELMDAIHQDESDILNKLWKEGKVKVHKTKDAAINDYVEFVGGN